MRVSSWVMLAALAAAGCGSAVAEDTVKVGIARSTSNAAELMALKHGYFKEAGIKLEWDDIDSTANVIALLAQNQYNIVAGGISAGIFNALEKDDFRRQLIEDYKESARERLDEKDAVADW